MIKHFGISGGQVVSSMITPLKIEAIKCLKGLFATRDVTGYTYDYQFSTQGIKVVLQNRGRDRNYACACNKVKAYFDSIGYLYESKANGFTWS